MALSTDQLIDVGLAHLGRFAFATRDNPFISSTPARRLGARHRATIARLVDGDLAVRDWLQTREAKTLIRGVRVGCVPRDLQLVTRDGVPTVGVESVHTFLHAPLFWWLVSNLWCIEVGRLVDPKLSENMKGYRLHARFVADAAQCGTMFRNGRKAYGRWSNFASSHATQTPGETLAASTLDLKDYYYSTVALPSEILNVFVSGLDEPLRIPRRARALTRLLDVLHAQVAKRSEDLRLRGLAPEGSLPLPVGAPSSRVLANLVMSRALQDIEDLPSIEAAAVYADDIVVVSRTFPGVEEAPLAYLQRLGLMTATGLVLRSGGAAPLATLKVNLEKSTTTYVRARTNEAGDTDVEGSELALDPYIEGDASPEWGGRLRTVLRAPYKRERIPRTLSADVRRLINEIRIGIDPSIAADRVTDLVADLDQAAFLALRPFWTELLVVGIAALGPRAVTILTDDFLKVAEALESPPLWNAAMRSALRLGLRLYALHIVPVVVPI
jgi:hypothetical protein